MLLINKIFTSFGILLFIFFTYLNHYMYFCEWNLENTDSTIERIVMLGDPQMEGDFRIKSQGLKGEYNIWFNDQYFRHIVSNIAYYLQPSYVFVLGDLFSNQRIKDPEFGVRVGRYRRIFEPLLSQNPQPHLYNITGNHDIGYAYEVTPNRLDRFEEAFGKVNDELEINGHIVGILNSMTLGSSLHEKYQNDSWDHLRHLKELKESTGKPVILITHIPLYKSYEYLDEMNNLVSIDRDQNPQILFPNNHPRYRHMCTEKYFLLENERGHVSEQSMLTKDTSNYILNELKPIFIFNGHDHDGCIYKHLNNFTIEYTVRSMMGDFGGYTGLFEIKRANNSNDEYQYSFKSCSFIETKFVNISFGVAIGWAVLFIFLNVTHRLVKKRKLKTKID